jgi:hypothetical protein
MKLKYIRALNQIKNYEKQNKKKTHTCQVLKNLLLCLNFKQKPSFGNY